MSKLRDWWHAPARWYEFWMPQSGMTGGLIGGTLLLVLLELLVGHAP